MDITAEERKKLDKHKRAFNVNNLICKMLHFGLGHKTVFVAVFARKKTENYYSL